MLFDQLEGRRTYYEIHPAAVRYQRQGGEVSITVVRGGVAVTITATVPAASNQRK